MLLALSLPLAAAGNPFGGIVGFIVWIVCLVGTIMLARNKGRSPVLWGILAFFFSLIALIVLAVLPSKAGV